MEKVTKTDAEWKAALDENTLKIARQGGTERPFSGKYHDYKGTGIFHCACCDNEMFFGETKYDSGTGWPSFWGAASDDSLYEKDDRSMGTMRIEVKCLKCDAHLGHVFPDGPPPSNKRYCINSASLRLTEKNG